MKQTTLDLNGPILSFLTHPSSVSVCDGGTVTFVGIATAYFPTQVPANPASNTGSLSYRWYVDGYGALTDGSFFGATISGTGTTTLTVTGVKSPTTDGLRFYLGVDYIHSAYSQPEGSTVTVGTGRSTGNAINEILNSSVATLTVYPTISVTKNPTDVTVAQTRKATFTAEGSSTNSTSVSYQWQLNDTDLVNSSTVSGAGTTSLTISLPNISTNTVRAKISHPTACNSPIYTNRANFTVVAAREIVNFEFIPDTGSGPATFLTSQNLFNGSYTISYTTQATQGVTGIICFYAAEKDTDVFIDMYAGRGFDYGSNRGGEGGVSTIKLTLKQNEEYVIASLLQATGGNAVFMYRKGRLIAVVGCGGHAGYGGGGGNGGGVNVAGANGFGSGAGAGGSLYLPGTLPSDGIFGSVASTLTPVQSGDSIASAPNGGRVLPCPKGRYWYGRGYPACSDIGNIQFYRENGNVATNSAIISRGFKAGYGIRNTSGLGSGGGGNGGGGATGGNGGTNGGGGGGGSGYSDGSIEIISTQQGGNYGESKVIFRSAA
jgi:hypothetical protein